MTSPLTTVTEPASSRRTFSFTLATGFLRAGMVAAVGGITGILLGRVWTVPVDTCGDGIGRTGAAPLWIASFLGLAIAAIVAVMSLVLAIVSAARHDTEAAGRSGLALLTAIVATVVSIVGVRVVWGDAPPPFCF